MKKITFIFISCLISISAYAKSDYELISSISSLFFSTIKSQYIIESSSMKPTEGRINQDGTFSITIPIDTINTGISIRDERVKDLFFDLSNHPHISVSGKLDLSIISNKPKLLSLRVNVKMYGNIKSIIFPVVIMKSDNYILVSSYSHNIISASDFGIPTDNLVKLAATVGSIKISDQVPVTFTLAFNKL
ncbi:YceI family protein [Photobacterium leiognathi]|uniref:YceI family protein n=2 Tax=Photobacterium leiognathi TaxID=553611 RepID=UPI0029829335|nr:YceI family protein [Photobacterium leiognathi]